MSYRYPARAIFWDYVRGGIGAAVFVVPVAAFDLPRLTLYVCLVMGALFAFYLGQTVVRHRTRIEMDDRVIRNLTDGQCFAWSDLNRVALRYFSVRRDRDAGWLELRLSSKERSLCMDSRIEGFEKIAARAARAAAGKDLPLDSATRRNLDALGIEYPRSEDRSV